jgi:hypothetical protein
VNAPLNAEILVVPADDDQLPLIVATEGVLRYVWQSRYGPILIEVRDAQTFVNGERVEPAR